MFEPMKSVNIKHFKMNPFLGYGGYIPEYANGYGGYDGMYNNYDYSAYEDYDAMGYGMQGKPRNGPQGPRQFQRHQPY